MATLKVKGQDVNYPDVVQTYYRINIGAAIFVSFLFGITVPLIYSIVKEKK